MDKYIPLFTMEKVCKNCGQTLTEDEFYKSKNMCIYCYKRQARLKKRVEAGRPIRTVAELMAELRTLPADAKVVLCEDYGLYRPTVVEFVRSQFKGNKTVDTDKYNNTIVIV